MMMRMRFQKCSNQHMVQNKWFLSKLKGLQCSCQCTSVQSSFSSPFCGELRMQKLKSHLVRTKSLYILPLKPGVGQYIAIHAMLTARDFFLANFYPSGQFTCTFSKTSAEFFPVLAVANTSSCVGSQNKIGHPAGCKFPW